MRLSFQFRLIPFMATVAVVLVGLSLGNWQTRRAEEKLSLAREQALQSDQPPLELQLLAGDAIPANFRTVMITGTFLTEWPIYLDNRPYQGRAGFYLLMPFKLKGSGKIILVMRGWLPRDTQDRQNLPATPTPQGVVKILGVVKASVNHVMQLGSEPALQAGVIRQNLEVAELSKASGLHFERFIIEQTSETSDGLLRDSPQPSLGSDKHRGYAFQWYGLAVTALIFFIVTGIKRAR